MQGNGWSYPAGGGALTYACASQDFLATGNDQTVACPLPAGLKAKAIISANLYYVDGGFTSVQNVTRTSRSLAFPPAFPGQLSQEMYVEANGDCAFACIAGALAPASNYRIYFSYISVP